MVGNVDGTQSTPVDALALAHGAAAWRLAIVAGADPAAATRAALHAVVIGAVEGGPAAGRVAILALARRWALTSVNDGPVKPGGGVVAEAFWSLAEPLRATLWCADGLGLTAADVAQVVEGIGPKTAAVARGSLRRSVCKRWRSASIGTACRPAADLLGRVAVGHATGTQIARVDRHTASCARCATVLASLRDLPAALDATLPTAPDLLVPARKAWRNHVGAPRRTIVERGERAAELTTSRRRPVAAVLAVAITGSFAAATTQLAASTVGPPLEATMTAPAPAPSLAAVHPTPPPSAPVRRQAIIPPLADEALLLPGLQPFVTPDLAEVTPVTVPVSPPPAVPAEPPDPPLPPGSNLSAEPPPAVDLSRVVELTVPLSLPLDLGFEVGPACTSIRLGPLRLDLPCRS